MAPVPPSGYATTGREIFIPNLIAGTLAAIGCWCHVVAVFYARISLDNNIEWLTTPTPAAKNYRDG